MFRSFQKCKDNLEDLEKVDFWTRSRFSLKYDDIVLVSENISQVPGCPPLETEIAFWTGRDTKYRFKIFKPVGEICESDLPVSWLMSALQDNGDMDCC